ncbi:coat protein [ssRNA phage SRR6960799_2]|uniref:Coat protein n=1 Tax=ssRNA phage SRR6960799_2 TaxID=2786576 RepID=A0A8S5L4K7_9VIRU|nr:coat protein [ssRNA phage SRR6960799_2]DAD52269.1 TPA_asm: coat protein [ssRNA phage SRR6960799_2]
MTINNGFTDTAIPGVSSLTFPRGLVNYPVDFRIASETSGELKLTNLTSPLDRPELVRIAYSVIPDVYKTSGINTSVQPPSTRGVGILCQVTNVYRDTTIATAPIDLPVSTHLVIRVPAHSSITASLIEAHIGRLISSLYDTGSTGTRRLESLLRGSLQPAGL